MVQLKLWPSLYLPRYRSAGCYPLSVAFVTASPLERERNELDLVDKKSMIVEGRGCLFHRETFGNVLDDSVYTAE